ncbi:MAG: S26 family signal peptidase, partial [Acidobacteriota bacterium]|nr:S26 family signal peptidase [Acidobacteriota bacterium]
MTIDPRRILRDFLLALVVMAVAVLLTTRYVAVPWVVRGQSMEPVLSPGDRVIVNLWIYHTRGPRPGEIVLLDGPGDVPLVKRVVATPGGLLPDPVLDPLGGEPVYYVLGDNSAASVDSRTFGAVPAHRFRGRVSWRYWPPSRAGRIR